jgi:dienelactone hydrolase
MSIASLFEYEKGTPTYWRETPPRAKDGILAQNLVYSTPAGVRRAAYLLRPEQATGPLAAILFVHWYEPHATTSFRTQFLPDAERLVKQGAVALLVETLWSDRDFFLKRSQDDDLDLSRQQVVELRQAMDILLAQPDVDANRFALVGHDFGGMYGVLAGAVDPRPTHYVIMAATPRFPDWYLYAPPLEGDARQAFIDRLAPLDPITNVAALAPAPILFQLGTDDFHVPVPRGEEFFAAAQEPKRLLWYEAGHGLNEQATEDRMKWLEEQLRLG